MKRLRSSLWMKVLAILVLCASSFIMLFFGLLAALELACYGFNDMGSLSMHYYGGAGNWDSAMNYFFMQEGGDSLTYLGQQEFDAQAQRIDPEETNFRYRVLDMEGNTLQTNVTDRAWEDAVNGDSVYRETYTVRELCALWAVQDYFAVEPTFYHADADGINFLGDYTKFSAIYEQLIEEMGILSADAETMERLEAGESVSGNDAVDACIYGMFGLLSGGTVEYKGDDTATDAKAADLQAQEAEVVVEEVQPWTEEDVLFSNLLNLACQVENQEWYESSDSGMLSWTDSGENAPTEEAIEAYQLPDEFLSEFQATIQELIETDCYILEWGAAADLPVADAVWMASVRYANWKTSFQYDCVITGLTALLWLLALIWLLAAAGHVEEQEKLHLSTLARCPQDFLLAVTAVCVVGLLALAFVLVEQTSWYEVIGQSSVDRNLMCAGLSGLGTVMLLLCLPFLTGTAVQLKDRSFWRRTLVARIFLLCWRTVRWVFRSLFGLLRAIPAAWKGMLAYAAFCVSTFLLFMLMFSVYSDWAILLLAALWIAGFLGVIWWENGWKRVQKAGKALAEGDLAYQTDTKRLPASMKQHAEHLNTVSQSVEQAVSERMRSDRFRTELITNVSHDLKTPLTSIINYVDLLKKLDLQDETAREYLDVLDRKSQRLKTLTEDLVEASKASAGVLPVNKKRIEVGELIRQAVGEYEDKLTAAHLEVRVHTPQEPVWIEADGRHTWRILENFFSNCTKYAMPGTRVYIDVIQKDGQVAVSVKNISADPLNLPAEELMERFVRGDESRTSEGSGLGLSIAQSLAHLQGAELLIQVDGDLFKAIILFPEEAPPSGADEVLPQ